MNDSGIATEDHSHRIVIHFDNLEKLLQASPGRLDERTAPSQDEEDRPKQAA